MAVRPMSVASCLRLLLLGCVAVSNVASTQPSGAAVPPPPIGSQVGDVPAPCFFCEYFVGAIKSELQKLPHAAVVQEVIALCIKEINNTNLCNTVVQSVELEILKALNTSAEVTCAKVNLCSVMNDVAERAAASFKLSTGTKKSFFCSVCTEAITQLDNYIWNNQESEEAKILQLCQALPQGTEQECVAEIKQRLPMLIKVLTNYLKPDTVCRAVKACSTRI